MRLLVPIASLIATWVFFFEYIPPFKKVHFYADIEGYHYPLLNYAHRALRQGHLPQWDSSTYSGYSLIGNTQAGLFYPPNWLLFFLNRRREGMKFFSVELLWILHVWISFVMAWLWLRNHRFGDHRIPALPAGIQGRMELAPILGAAVYAFSGFPIGESQHLGAQCAYAWFPLAFWGIDEFADGRGWRKLWKLTATSALAFLAGYTSMWVAFCVFTIAYAAAAVPWRKLPFIPLALVSSIPLFLLQLIPAMEASMLKLHEQVFGNGIGGGAFFYLEYLFPNYFDQSHKTGELGLIQEQYMYLGAAAIAAIVFLVMRGRWKDWRPIAALTGCALLFTINPGRILEGVMLRLPYLWETVREWNFLAAISLAAALASAHGVLYLLQAPAWQSRALGAAAAATSVLWNARQVWLWTHDGAGFATGWWTLLEASVTSVLVLLLIRAAPRWWLSTALLLTVFVEYKVYGTSRRFSAAPNNPDIFWASDRRTGGKDFFGVNSDVYRDMLNNPDCRLALLTDQPPTDMRHYSLNTPTGFDPFLPARYRRMVERFTRFETNRTFRFDWKQDAMLDAFAVRYLMVTSGSAMEKQVAADARFTLMNSEPSFFHVFEYRSARPSVRFEAGALQRVSWTPERRVVRVNSERGGQLQFIEQQYPGWRAFIDGEEVPIAIFNETFQAIQVPSGRHSVEFRFASPGFRWAAAVSLVSLFALIFIVYKDRAQSRIG